MPTQDKPKAETGGDPPGNGQENDQDTAPPGPRPTSNVYHLYFTTGELPEANADKAQFAREYLSNLIPDTPDGITYYLQHQNQEDEYLLTIIVPNRLTSTVSQLESSGFQPSFTEPEHPYIEDNSFVVPRSLQVLRIGALIDPLTASNNPQYMWELSSMLQDNVKDPPHHALDINNWTNIYIDDDTGTALISWTPFDEDQQEQ